MNTQAAIFAQRLKDLRKSIGLTQSDLSKKLGLGRTAVSNYETSRTMPDPITLSELSKLFGVSTDYLLGNTNNKSEIVHTTNELESHDKFMKNLEVHFMDASERDRDKIYRDISELYWKYKDEK